MPKYAVMTDIHANRDALEAVLEDFEEKEIEAIWFLGDLLDPGPHPAAVFHMMKKRLQEKPDCVWLAGNHDKGLEWLVCGESEQLTAEKRCYDALNDAYRYSAEVCCNAMTREQIIEVANHPTQSRRKASDLGTPSIYFAHGFPDKDDVQSCINYDINFAPDEHGDEILKIRQEVASDTQIWLVGHSHRQTAWWFNGKKWSELMPGFGTDLAGGTRSCIPTSKDPESLMVADLDFSQAGPDGLLILNPGSLGFPRDGVRVADFNIAKYLLLELNGSQIKVCFRAIPYKFKTESVEIWKKWYPAAMLNQLALIPETINEENGIT